VAASTDVEGGGAVCGRGDISFQLNAFGLHGRLSLTHRVLIALLTVNFCNSLVKDGWVDAIGGVVEANWAPPTPAAFN
jgi:hypothetical protein